MDDVTPNPDCPGCQMLLKKVAALEARLARLEARARQDSSNSNRPPSSDPPWLKPKGGGFLGERKPGAQPGHQKSSRDFLPPDQVQCCKPKTCGQCGGTLQGVDHAPHRHQVTEIPPARATVVEYQLHTLKCGSCGHLTRAPLPSDVPRGAFGPRLQSMVALLSGVYRISKRNTTQLMSDAFGVQMSLGAVSKIEGQVAKTLAGPHQSVLRAIHRAPAVHSDETSWREGNQSAWLWSAVAKGKSAFLIRRSRGSEVAKELIGAGFKGIHVSDRWSGYDWIDIEQRQVCWAHLIRDFRKIADSGGLSHWIGTSLERDASELFGYWHRVRDGTLQRSTFRRHAGRIRQHMIGLLKTGTQCTQWRAPSLCRGILKLESAMWTFVKREGIEPTNNTAERVLRPAVIWRKTSLGTQSARGSRFVERILSCVATLRQNGRNALEYLTSATEAALRGMPIPSFVR